MGKLLQLFTLLSDLNFTQLETPCEIEEGDTTALSETSFELRDGEIIRIHEISDDEGISWIISGGHIFRDFNTFEAAQSFFFDLQKKPGLLYSHECSEDF